MLSRLNSASAACCLLLGALLSALSVRHQEFSLGVVEASATMPTPAPLEAGRSHPNGPAEDGPGTIAWLDAAIYELGRFVPRQSHPEALRRAFAAYGNYRATHPDRVRKPYLYFVDFGLDNRTPRGYVFNMETMELVEGPFTVAHGRGSVRGSNSPVPTVFSNTRNSNMTSLGLYLAQETYGFRGRSGGRQYTSVGLRLEGLSGPFNSAARARGIVVHGAPYVTSLSAGRSEGCPAMEEDRARRLLPRLANGGMVYHFSPLDEAWLRNDPWSGASVRGLAGAR
jgi:hypothetical protein